MRVSTNGASATQIWLGHAGPSVQPSQTLPPKTSQAAVAPQAATQDGQRWSVKHAPATEADLVVAKKKVASIKEWLVATRDAPAAAHLQRVLLLTGVCTSLSSLHTAGAMICWATSQQPSRRTLHVALYLRPY